MVDDLCTFRQGRREGERGADQDETGDRVGAQRGELQRVPRTTRQSDGDDVLDVTRIEHRGCIGGVGLGRVAGRVRDSVGSPVAGPVVDDDVEVAGEVGHLHLPEPGVDDRPGRHEQDRRAIGSGGVAVDLVAERDAVAHDTALHVGIPSAHVVLPWFAAGNRCCATQIGTATPPRRSRAASSSRSPRTQRRSAPQPPRR